MITKIDKITVYVNSQAEAKRFWIEKMGFAVALEIPMGPDATWLEMAPSAPGGKELATLIIYSKALMLAQNPSAVAHPGVMFKSDDIEATYKDLKEKGVVVGALNSYPYGKMFDFKDPDGNSYIIRN